ncbi:MAG: M48 family peptidase [Deltaproteobacteria bacterium]|nr:MAG: M48 family peptidase [Deltaproteobacteria bacterium]
MNPRRVLALLAAAAMLVACARVPYTKRIQLNMIPEPLVNSIGRVSYAQMLSGANVRRGGDDAAVLQRVGRRISRVAKKPKYKWEFSLISDSTINAWCLPGGYIGFYTGILPVLKNEAGMAFVMGHEVGHATARHGAERISQQLTLIGGLVGLELLLSKETNWNPEERAIVLGALGVGAQFGIMLPFSRMHETEADVIGLMYMAEAGYPPAESIRVWDRMNEAAGPGLPSFLSTHPSHKKRQKNLREWMPRARKRYERNKLDRNTREVLWSGNATGRGRRL